jgi:hypothetical protein
VTLTKTGLSVVRTFGPLGVKIQTKSMPVNIWSSHFDLGFLCGNKLLEEENLVWFLGVDTGLVLLVGQNCSKFATCLITNLWDALVKHQAIGAGFFSIFSDNLRI